MTDRAAGYPRYYNTPYVMADMASGFFDAHYSLPSSHIPPDRRSYLSSSSTMEQPQLAVSAHEPSRIHHLPYPGSHHQREPYPMSLFPPQHPHHPQHHHNQHSQPHPSQAQHHQPHGSSVMSPGSGRKRRVSDSEGGPTLPPPPPSMSSSSSSAFIENRYGALPPENHSPEFAPAPKVKKTRTNKPWTAEEEHRLRLCRQRGETWSEIAKGFPNRTEGSVKKHWYKDMHYANFGKEEHDALLLALKDYEANKWKFIGNKLGKPAKACEQYAKEHFSGLSKCV